MRDYEGKYRGHVWDMPEELFFAMGDLNHAYEKLICVPLTAAGISDAKSRMEEAMDRMARATAAAHRALQPKQ